MTDAERARRVITAMAARGETVATAESLTAGLLTALLTSVPGSSAVVRGGLVVYATDLKERLAGVDAALLAEHGAVHPLVAAALAEGARTRCGADVGIGLTGVAGPDPQDGAAPGTVFVALDSPRGTRAVALSEPGDRETVRAGAVRAALGLLEAHLGVDVAGPGG